MPSPRPHAIVETDSIRALLDGGAIVVAAGGGGIPVAHRAGRHASSGVEAVVDKDLASGLLAHELGADLLLIPTGVPRVAIRFGTPDQRWLDTHHRRRGARLHRTRASSARAAWSRRSPPSPTSSRATPARGRRHRRGRGDRGDPGRHVGHAHRGRRAGRDLDLQSSTADAVLLAVNGTLDARAEAQPQHGRRRRDIRPGSHHRAGLPAVDDRRRPPRDGPGHRRLGRRGRGRGLVGSARRDWPGSCSPSRRA